MATRFYKGTKPLLSQPSIGGGKLGRVYVGGQLAYGAAPISTWGTPPSQDGNCWMFWDASDVNCYPGTGTAITDLKGNSDGTINGSTWSYETEAGLGVLRNSAPKGANYISAGAYSTVNTGQTFEVWWNSHSDMSGDGVMAEWKGGSTSYQTIYEANIQQFASPARHYVYQSGESGNPRGGDVIYNDVVAEGEWIHMVVTSARNDVNRMYINGVERATGDPSTETFNSTETWVWDQAGVLFGANNGSKNWIGQWAVFRGYSVALSAAEVLANYNFYNAKV